MFESCGPVLVVLPISGLSEAQLRQRHERIRKFAGDGYELRLLDGAPAAIETVSDEVQAAALVVSHLRSHARSIEHAYSAVVVWCAGDPGIRAARSLLRIPVLGPGEASARLAAMVADRFGVIVPLPEESAQTRYQYRGYGLEAALVGITGLGVPVLELQDDPDATRELLREHGSWLVERGAECIVLNCMGLAGFDRELARELGIPVVDPVAAVFAQLAAFGTAEISFSAATYPVIENDETTKGSGSA